MKEECVGPATLYDTQPYTIHTSESSSDAWRPVFSRSPLDCRRLGTICIVFRIQGWWTALHADAAAEDRLGVVKHQAECSLCA